GRGERPAERFAVAPRQKAADPIAAEVRALDEVTGQHATVSRTESDVTSDKDNSNGFPFYRQRKKKKLCSPVRPPRGQPSIVARVSALELHKKTLGPTSVGMCRRV